MSALPLLQVEHLEINVEEIRKGWFRAYAGSLRRRMCGR